jgi:hypothetical protein
MTDFMPGQLVMLKSSNIVVTFVWCWAFPRDSSKSRGHRNGTIGLYINSSSPVPTMWGQARYGDRGHVLIEDQIWSVPKIDLIAFAIEQGNTE